MNTKKKKIKPIKNQNFKKYKINIVDLKEEKKMKKKIDKILRKQIYL